MRKKLLTVCLLILTVAALLCLTACSANNIQYVQSSFQVTEINYYDSIHSINGTIEFEIKSPIDCSCDLKYTVAVKNATTNKTAFSKEINVYGCKIKKDEAQKIVKYLSFDSDNYSETVLDSLMDNAIIELQDIEIIDKTSGANEQYDDYAIGFGVASGILLIGLITLFIVIKICS